MSDTIEELACPGYNELHSYDCVHVIILDSFWIKAICRDKKNQKKLPPSRIELEIFASQYLERSTSATRYHCAIEAFSSASPTICILKPCPSV